MNILALGFVKGRGEGRKLFHTPINIYASFTLFALIFLSGFFCENEASSEHLNVSRCIFFVSDVFLNFQVKFSTQVSGGHFENIDLALKYQFKTIFYKYKHLY